MLEIGMLIIGIILALSTLFLARETRKHRILYEGEIKRSMGELHAKIGELDAKITQIISPKSIPSEEAVRHPKIKTTQKISPKSIPPPISSSHSGQ